MAIKNKDEAANNSAQAAEPLDNATAAKAEADAEAEPDHDEATSAIEVPDSGETSEGGKLKMIVQILKRCLGVKDLASMRMSLPASLLEPIPNLEYWHYLDRPDLFASINDSEDHLERMLAVIRFTFSKDLKFIKGKVVKPYNSVLGEHFRSHWDVLPVEYPSSNPSQAPIFRHHTTSCGSVQDAASSVFGNGPKDESVLSFRSSKSWASKRASSLFEFATARVTPLPASMPASPVTTGPISNKSNDSGYLPDTAVESNLAAGTSSLSLSAGSAEMDSVIGSSSGEEQLLSQSQRQQQQRRQQQREAIRVAFLTEQISHHPPISAYRAECPARGVVMHGVDQISARVSGAAVRVLPGSFNKGIFVELGEPGPGAGEMYHITHPSAMVNGVLRGSFYVTIAESTVITCYGSAGAKDGEKRLRAIIEYKEEPWLGAPKFAVEGVIHTFCEGDTAHEAWTKVKHVPRSAVKAYLDGSWRGRIYWRPADVPSSRSSADKDCDRDWDRDGTQLLLLDLTPLQCVPKYVRPLSEQHTYESRRLWEGVTSRLRSREFSDATRAKHGIEQRQRDFAAERKRKGEEFVPVYFTKDISSGIPTLTVEGRKALEEESKRTNGEL